MLFSIFKEEEECSLVDDIIFLFLMLFFVAAVFIPYFCDSEEDGEDGAMEPNAARNLLSFINAGLIFISLRLDRSSSVVLVDFVVVVVFHVAFLDVIDAVGSTTVRAEDVALLLDFRLVLVVVLDDDEDPDRLPSLLLLTPLLLRSM